MISSPARELVLAARHLQQAARDLGLISSRGAVSVHVSEFDALVTDKDLRAASSKLFRDAHYARAVEEAYKCLNNVVKNRCRSTADGADLMRTALSPKKPLLKLNKLLTESQKNEQLGYMDILAGCMTGIRNPRAHEHRLVDSKERALQLLGWANHLMERVKSARRSKDPTAS